jgi:16S rRNA (cytosine967-C5)-methyltransferase
MYRSHLRTAVQILCLYDGKTPFANFIRQFYSKDKKYGSKDRKSISSLCYSYFRLGHSLKNLPIEDRILNGLFLCSQGKNELLEYFYPEWNRAVELPLQEKLKLADPSFVLKEIFPWQEELSEGIVHEDFCRSFLVQPDLFLRMRPGMRGIVMSKLTDSGIRFREIGEEGLALDNSTKIDQVLLPDREVVVQDLSSQKTAEIIRGFDAPINAWDCCAGSGGKSILLQDLFPGIKLTATDNRSPILANYKKRMKDAGIKNFQCFVSDLIKPIGAGFEGQYDLVLADLPCSGSGTWARNPDSLCFFDPKSIDRFADLQKRILANVVSGIREGGRMVYITCSVFRKENEAYVEWLSQQFGLQVENQQLLKGYGLKADSMFGGALRS